MTLPFHSRVYIEKSEKRVSPKKTPHMSIFTAALFIVGKGRQLNNTWLIAAGHCAGITTNDVCSSLFSVTAIKTP